jgi:uncharacterized repeat protein (TIGR02543 family)
MCGDYSITANFAPIPPVQYTLTMAASPPVGTTSPAVGQHVYAVGTQVPIVATPSGGYQFVNWTGDVGTVANVSAASTTITMAGNYSITANFAIDISLSIDVEKYVWDGATWHDADTAPGPSLTAAHDPVIFKFVIDNDGTVQLTNVNLVDTDISAFYINQACTTPAVFPIPILSISPSVTVYGQLPWAAGQHSNTATATGEPPVGDPVSDTDPSHYFGLSP